MQDQNESYDFDTAKDRLAVAGINPDALVDPADVSPEQLREGGWLYVRADATEVSRYDVGPTDVSTDYVRYGEAEVSFELGSAQPVGFEERLNEEPVDLSQGYNPSAAYFVDPDAEAADAPKLSKRQAVGALSVYGSEAWVPGPAADAITGAFACPADIWRKDDPDVSGGSIVRASSIAKAIAAEEFGGFEEADSDINGHKKRRRQVFYRNLELLRDEFEVHD